MQAEQILATACENESDNAKRMRVGLEPVSQPMPTLPAATVSNKRRRGRTNLSRATKLRRLINIATSSSWLVSNYVAQFNRVSGMQTTTWYGHRNVSPINLKIIIALPATIARVFTDVFLNIACVTERLAATRAQPSNALADNRIH